MNRLFSNLNILNNGLLCAVIIFLASSCSNKASAPSGNNEILIDMDSVVVRDSIVDAGDIKIIVSTDIAYPKLVKNNGKNSANTFIELYFSTLLESSYESNGETTIKNAVAKQLESYKAEDDGANTIEEEEDDAVSRYAVATNIRPCYHNFDFFCFKKSTTSTRDNKKPINTVQYITLDVKGEKQIHVTDIFNEQYFSKLTEIIRDKLFADHNCKNANQLADLGFFNIDNLFVPDNISLSDTSIIFHYNPLEIACNAIGVVDVSIPFNELSSYINEDSAVRRIQE